MRLTKKMYIIRNETPIIDYDRLGRPIYGEPNMVYDPIPCEVEPYSNELALNQLGLYAEVSNRAFCEPNKDLALNIPIRYNEEDLYKITGLLKYDKHYEVLIKRERYA